jgi:hypothetical protein
MSTKKIWYFGAFGTTFMSTKNLWWFKSYPQFSDPIYRGFAQIRKKHGAWSLDLFRRGKHVEIKQILHIMIFNN